MKQAQIRTGTQSPPPLLYVEVALLLRMVKLCLQEEVLALRRGYRRMERGPLPFFPLPG